MELLIWNHIYLTFSFLSNLRLSFSVIQDHKFSVVFKQHLSSCYHRFPYSFIIQSNLKAGIGFIYVLHIASIYTCMYWLIYYSCISHLPRKVLHVYMYKDTGISACFLYGICMFVNKTCCLIIHHDWTFHNKSTLHWVVFSFIRQVIISLNCWLIWAESSSKLFWWLIYCRLSVNPSVCQ